MTEGSSSVHWRPCPDRSILRYALNRRVLARYPFPTALDFVCIQPASYQWLMLGAGFSGLIQRRLLPIHRVGPVLFQCAYRTPWKVQNIIISSGQGARCSNYRAVRFAPSSPVSTSEAPRAEIYQRRAGEATPNEIADRAIVVSRKA